MTHVNNKQLELPIATPSHRANASEGEKLSEINVRAITLWQPWASLVALGLKQFETRSWSTNRHRGKLLIHASARPICGYGSSVWEDALEKGQALIEQLHGSDFPFMKELPLGAVVAIADLTNCGRMMPAEGYKAEWEVKISDQTELELAVGDWAPGRYAWKLENVKALTKPIYCKGGQRLWIPSQEIIKAVGGVA